MAKNFITDYVATYISLIDASGRIQENGPRLVT